MYTVRQFKELLDLGAVDYVQPDVSHAGGVTALREIAALADCHHVSFAPHNPSGPVANVVTLQLAACIPNFLILEIMDSDVVWRSEITDEALAWEADCLVIPDKPGIGVFLNEEVLSQYPYTPKDPRHYKGTLTDIRPPERSCYF